MKTNRILFIAFLIFGLFAFQKVNYAQTYFSNSNIELFGGSDISKIYEDSESIYITQPVNMVTFVVELNISDPLTVQIYINNSLVKTQTGSGGVIQIKNYNFVQGSNYLVTVRVTYAQHYSNYICGTWTGYGGLYTDI